MSGKRPSDQFSRGYLIAVANLVNMHGQSVEAREVLQAFGKSRSVLNKMDFTEYDAAPLRKLFPEMERFAVRDHIKGASHDG